MSDTDQDRVAEILARRLHQLVDDVVEDPGTLERILAATVRVPHPVGTGNRTRFRLVAAAAAAAVLACGVYLAVPHDNANGSGRATASPGLTASQVLYRVAEVADATVLTGPRDDQYEYVKLVERMGGTTRTFEEWLPESASADGVAHVNGRFAYTIASWDTGRTPGSHDVYPNYAWLESLPTDPATVLDAVDAAGKHPVPGSTAAQTSFSNVVGLLSDRIMPPKLAAAVYRALAALPGIAVDQDAVDAAGRHGVAVSTTVADGVREELIFDRTSYRLIGTDVVPPADGSTARTGTVGFTGPSSTAIVQQGIADNVGQAPKN